MKPCRAALRPAAEHGMILPLPHPPLYSFKVPSERSFFPAAWRFPILDLVTIWYLLAIIRGGEKLSPPHFPPCARQCERSVAWCCVCESWKLSSCNSNKSDLITLIRRVIKSATLRGYKNTSWGGIHNGHRKPTLWKAVSPVTTLPDRGHKTAVWHSWRSVFVQVFCHFLQI